MSCHSNKLSREGGCSTGSCSSDELLNGTCNSSSLLLLLLLLLLLHDLLQLLHDLLQQLHDLLQQLHDLLQLLHHVARNVCSCGLWLLWQNKWTGLTPCSHLGQLANV